MLKVDLCDDPSVESPDTADLAWTLHSFNRRHSTFKEPVELGLGAIGKNGIPVVHNAVLEEKLEKGLAFWLSYFEHGDCLWMLRDTPAPPGVEFQWDGRRLAGLLVWEHPEEQMGAGTLESRKEDARCFLKEYTAWCNGEGVGFVILDDSDTVIDHCFGFLDAETMCDTAAVTLAGHDFVVLRDIPGLEDLLRARVKLTEETRVMQA